MDPMTKAFVADIHHFIDARGLDLVHFGQERKDEVTQRYLAGFTGTEGVLYGGRHKRRPPCGGPSAATTPMAVPMRGW